MTGKNRPFAHLRPTTPPEMLDRAYAVAVRFAPVMLLASILFAAEHLVSITAGRGTDDTPTTPAFVAGLLAVVFIGEFAAAAAQLALFQGIIFPRRPLSGRALARTSLRKLPGYLLTHLLYVFTVALVATITWGLFASRQGPDPLMVSIGASFVTGLTGLYFAIRFSLAPIACLIEDSNPFKAFGRSWSLTTIRPRTHEYPTDRPLLRWLCVAMLPAAVITLTATVFAAYSYFYLEMSITASAPETAVAKELFWFTTTFLATPFYWAGLMGLYVEYRMRHEALDFYLRIRELRQEESPGRTLT